MVSIHHSLRMAMSPLPQGKSRGARMLCAFCNFICTTVFLACVLLSRTSSAFIPALGGVILSLLPMAVQLFGALVPYGIWSLYEVFLFCSVFLGERMDFYTKFSWWDVSLHAISGFCFAAIGLSLIRELFGTQEPGGKRLWGTVVFILCFACTAGVMWEFVEFSADRLFDTDMQRDTILSSIASRQVANGQTIKDIHMELNGETFDGILDVGLQDTMTDQIAAMAGSFVFAALYVFCGRHRFFHKTVKDCGTGESIYKQGTENRSACNTDIKTCVRHMTSTESEEQRNRHTQSKDRKNGVIELFVIRS